MKGHRYLWMIMLIAAALLLDSCAFMPQEEELPAAPVMRKYEAKEYKFAAVMRGDLTLEKKVRCTYMPAREEELSFAVGGEYIGEIYVTRGQQVKAGQVLAELNQGGVDEKIAEVEYQITVLQMKQQHLEQNQQLEMKRHDILLEGITVQLQEIRAKLQLQNAEGQETLKQQEAELLKQKEMKEKAKQSVVQQFVRQQKELADAIYIQQLRLQEMKEQRRERQIIAGMDGTVTRVKAVSEGQRSIENEVFIVLSDMDSAVFAVSGEDAQYFSVGEEFDITQNKKTYRAKTITAEELGLSSSVEEKTPMAYLQLFQPDPTLEDGNSGSIIVVLDQRSDVLYLNKKAVKTADNSRFVYRLDEDGLKVMQKVTTGLETGDWIEIIDGLKEGDSVIVE